jgi:hypothetical protein
LSAGLLPDFFRNALGRLEHGMEVILLQEFAPAKCEHIWMNFPPLQLSAQTSPLSRASLTVAVGLTNSNLSFSIRATHEKQGVCLLLQPGGVE